MHGQLEVKGEVTRGRVAWDPLTTLGPYLQWGPPAFPAPRPPSPLDSCCQYDFWAGPPGPPAQNPFLSPPQTSNRHLGGPPAFWKPRRRLSQRPGRWGHHLVHRQVHCTRGPPRHTHTRRQQPSWAHTHTHLPPLPGPLHTNTACTHTHTPTHARSLGRGGAWKGGAGRLGLQMRPLPRPAASKLRPPWLTPRERSCAIG